MVSKSELKSSGPRSFPVRGEYEFAFQFIYSEVPLKKPREGLLMLFIADGRLKCFNCGWRGVISLGRWERWEGGEFRKVGKVGGW